MVSVALLSGLAWVFWITATCENSEAFPRVSLRLTLRVSEVGCKVGGLPKVLMTMLLTRVEAGLIGNEIFLPLTPHTTGAVLTVHASPELMTTGRGMSTASVPDGLPLGRVS